MFFECEIEYLTPRKVPLEWHSRFCRGWLSSRFSRDGAQSVSGVRKRCSVRSGERTLAIGRLLTSGTTQSEECCQALRLQWQQIAEYEREGISADCRCRALRSPVPVCPVVSPDICGIRTCCGAKTRPQPGQPRRRCCPARRRRLQFGGQARDIPALSLIHISEPTRLGMISYAVF